MLQRLARFFVYWIAYFLLRLRYRFTVYGLSDIKRENLSKRGGILFLPNHPAEIDPIILSVILWRKFFPRPVVVEWVFELPLIKNILHLMKAVPMPDFEESGTHSKRRRADKSFQTVVEGLKKQNNFLLYPAGRLKTCNLEILGGASGTYKTLEACPDANVVLVRSIGLWGSSFSRAYSDVNLYAVLLRALGTILKNGIFFVPKKDIYIEFSQPNPKEISSFTNRQQLNLQLEQWYNRPVTEKEPYHTKIGEPLIYRPYAFWDRRATMPKPQADNSIREVPLDRIPDEIIRNVAEEIARMMKKLPSEIYPEQKLFADLRLDSLDIQELLTFLEDCYGVEKVKPKDLTTVLSVMAYAAGLYEVVDEDLPKEKVSIVWEKEDTFKDSFTPFHGNTICEVFFNNCDKHKNNIACVDPIVGELSYQSVKKGVLLLAQALKKIPGEYIGILFPSSAIVNLLILASHIAHKVPVMINWTVGPMHLKHLLSVVPLQCVLTSNRVLKNLSNLSLPIAYKRNL